MRMGGRAERIQIMMIAHPDANQAEAKLLLERQFESFDAAQALCFRQDDRQQLLAVIESGFGDCKEFNKNVRGVFASHARPSWSTRRNSSTRSSRDWSPTLGRWSSKRGAVHPASQPVEPTPQEAQCGAWG